MWLCPVHFQETSIMVGPQTPPHPTPTLLKPQGKALMRAWLPHPSGPHGDLPQYSTATGQATPEPWHIIHIFLKFELHHRYCIWCRLQLSESDSSENRPPVFAANSRPPSPAEHQMFWQLFFCDLHGNYIPLYKHRNTSSTMCCVIAGQRRQCMGMNLKASLNEFNMNCKWLGAIRAADCE